MASKYTSTQIGLHSVKNILGNQQQLSLFSDYSSSLEEKGLSLQGTVDRFGVDLSDMQAKIMEGILRAFSETSYKGNIDPIDKSKIEEENYFGQNSDFYKHIEQVPRIRITQSRLLELCEINKNSIATWARGVSAIKELGTMQFCFYYDRLVYDENKIPQRDSSGKWMKEEVVAIDSLFTIKEIREEGMGILKYYEIEPSAIFLDQRESYFLLIPFGWREEVKSLVGNKKASSYTFRFLLFLRYQYELFRRSSKKNRPFQLKWTAEEIAIAIKMPESVYNRKKQRALEILNDAYSVAKRLEYLEDYTIQNHVHILTFNEKKYSNYERIEPTQIKDEIDSNSSAGQLFNIFHQLKESIDKLHKKPVEADKTNEVNDFKKLLALRPFEDIVSLMKWGLERKYWCTKLSSPRTLRENFGEAWAEMILSSHLAKEDIEDSNKNFAEKYLLKYQDFDFQGKRIEILNKGIEIGNGVHQPTCITFTDKAFKDKLSDALKRWQIPISID